MKKSNLSDFKNIRKGGIIAIRIEDGDRLIDCRLTTGEDEIVLITHDGMSIRFHEEEMRDQGRDAVGVWGIRPEKGDYVVGAAVVSRDGAARCRRERPGKAHELRGISGAKPGRQGDHHDEGQ